MGNSTAQCASALEPSCKAGELPAQCEPCVQAVEDAVLIDPGTLWDSSEADSDCPPQPSSGSSDRAQKKMAPRPLSGVGTNAFHSRHVLLKVGPPRIAAAPPQTAQIQEHRVREAPQSMPANSQLADTAAQEVEAPSLANEASVEFHINRFSTSQYLPTPQALERLGDPDEEEEPPMPKSKPVELSRDAARQQRGVEQAVDEREANNDNVMSVPPDHLPLPQDHLRQNAPVALPRTVSPVTPSQDQLAAEVWEVYAAATQRAAQASLRGSAKQAWNSASLQQPSGALACYASTVMAQNASARLVQNQAADHALKSTVPLASTASMYKASSRFSPSGFAIRV